MKCSLCNKEGTIKAFDSGNVECVFCTECANELLKEGNWIIYKGVLYSRLNENIINCRGCGAYVHKDQAALQDGRCLSCQAMYYNLKNRGADAEAHYCPDCDAIHRKGMCPTGLHDEVTTSSSISFNVRNQDKNWYIKGDSVHKDSYVKKIGQFQTERELRPEDREMLNKFYRGCRKFTHYYTREPVNIEGEVSYYNYELVNKVKNYLDNLRFDARDSIEDCVKISKYYNYYIKGLDETGLVKWQFIDIMGNVRERSESINKFFQDIGKDVDNANMFCKFKYRLSSDINHKIDAFKLNERVGSCQKSGNCDSYARGAYDAITNGCNCPLLIYTPKNKLIARITTRIMYDEQGDEYILIDRIYHSGEFSDQMMKGEIYKAIVKDLKAKGYKVIASPYSAHDRSTYAYLYSLGLKAQGEVHNLCQPLRGLVGGFGYYCDGGTEVYKGEIDGLTRATDYLDKAYLF